MRTFILYIKNIYSFKIFILILLSFGSLQAEVKFQKWGTPINLTVLNSSKDEYAPQFIKFLNLLYFNSERENFSYFYSGSLDSNSSFTEPKLLKSEINELKRNQSYISSPDNEEAYFSKYRQSDKQSYLNIYRTLYQKKNWTQPFLVDSLITDAFCSHVTVSPDGNLMIFASTRESGLNDIDLWMSYRNENGNWSIPISLEELNSQGNEITPYLYSNDTLFFSSDGYEGPGGYDIYLSTRSGGKWNRPTPLFDINTEFNESDFTVIPDGRAIFASDKPGGAGMLDLYIVSPIYTPEEILVREQEVSIRTQASNIIAEKNSIISRYPAFHFFGPKTFELSSNLNKNILDSLLFEYPVTIAQFLKSNPNEILVIDSSSINSNITAFFNSKGINSDRIIFQNSDNKKDIIKFKLLSGNQLPVTEIEDNFYNYKPPVLEISIESREKIDLFSHILSFITESDKHEFQLNEKKLPLRDIISLDEFDSEIYNSDSVIINYKIYNNINQILTNVSRVLFVSRQQTKTVKLSGEIKNKFEEYFLVMPDNIFLNSDYFPVEYFNNIVESTFNAASIKIIFFNEIMKSQAGKIKDLLLSKISPRKPDIKTEKQVYKENKNFSADISDMILKIEIYKPQ